MAKREQLWGELEPKEDDIDKGISPQLANMIIQKSMKPVPLGLYQPCGNQEPSVVELPPECSAMDETVLQTIRLRQYETQLKDMIKLAKNTSKKSTELPILPEFPVCQDWKPRYKLTYPLRYMERISSPFTRGEGDPPHPLSRTNALKILSKSVATILAHIGYDNTSQHVLDTLTDVSHDYFLRFTHLLRVATDGEAFSGSTGFPDALERVFHEMGIGSMLTLHVFYRDRVLLYRDRLLAECRSLTEEYLQLTKPVIKQETCTELLQPKLENDEDEGDVPEIHFPALGEGYAVDELQPSLEPGFQMLHSLEQEEQLQNMDAEEEINVSDSPSQDMGFQSSSDQATTPGGSRKNKRKRK